MILNSLFSVLNFLRRGATLLLALPVAALCCVNPPPPTAAARELERNPRAIIEGRVFDIQGHPVPGLRVEAIPRGKDVDWSPVDVTDADGRFTLVLFAPAYYGFVLHQEQTAVVTDDPRDPSRVHVSVSPGGQVRGVELLFLRGRWKEILSGQR